MAENSNEEHLDDSINNQSENLPEEIILIKDPENITQNQETENMEVHHHAHDPEAPHHKKNWKSYFWECLMLFLAVFCGFLAEYKLEHVIEHSREKQFIESFVEDLKIDIAAIDRNLIFQSRKRKQLDSLNTLLREKQIKGFENELYYLSRVLVRTTRFQSNDRTITQLRYSGGLRLIRNENAADSITSYQNLVDYITQNQDDERIERRAVDPLLARMFDPFVFDKMLDELNNVNKPTDNPPLRSYDPELQLDLAYAINQLKGSNIILKTRLELLSSKAKNIIAFLKEEYHLN